MSTVKHFTRREMREVMQIRGFSEVTISTYINHVRNLAEYFNKPPHTLQPEHLHEYQVFLVQEKQVSWSLFNQTVCAMRFFLTM
jgi:integrase/recombinase XerD